MKYRGRRFAVCGALWLCAEAHGAAVPDLTSISLEQLLDVRIIGASKCEQKQDEVAAAVSVITRQANYVHAACLGLWGSTAVQANEPVMRIAPRTATNATMAMA